MIDGNVAAQYTGHGGQRTSWAVNIQISETNPLSGDRRLGAQLVTLTGS